MLKLAKRTLPIAFAVLVVAVLLPALAFAESGQQSSIQPVVGQPSSAQPMELQSAGSLQAAPLGALGAEGGVKKSGSLTVSGLDPEMGGLLYRDNSSSQMGRFQVSYDGAEASATVTVSSSKNAVFQIFPQNWQFTIDKGTTREAYGIALDRGMATVSVVCGNDKVSFPVVACPESTDVKQVTKSAYNTVKVTWKSAQGATGYLVQRAAADRFGYATGSFSNVKRVRGRKTSVSVTAPFEKNYLYRVVPFVVLDGKTYQGDEATHGSTVAFALPRPVVAIKSVTSAKAGLKVDWKADKGATSFVVYRSESENRGYKRIASTTGKTYTDRKAKKGTVYYYRVKAKFKNKVEATSNSYAMLVPKSVGVLRKKLSRMEYWALYRGSYDGFYDENTRISLTEIGAAHADRLFYYTQGSRLYAVHYYYKQLRIYSLSSNGKIKSAKTVKLPSHTIWGGMFHGADGNNYVALGYDNPKDSKSKTVVKVVKYSKKWKKGKSAVIKGMMKSDTPGIRTPFFHASAGFDLSSDGTLYLSMGRRMFNGHQAGAGFAINTKTMKAKLYSLSPASHSVNQFVRFKDGSIFKAEHGDAYPRAIRVVIQDEFGKKGQVLKIADAFEFEGYTGNNVTGARVGGLEVGKKHVLVCGTAQPHGYKVGGATGFGGYKQNVFVARVDRVTGDSKVIWQTNFKAKGGKFTVGECRMLKISDDRFALLYAVTNDKTGETTLYYQAISDTGKKLVTKKYSNMNFRSGSQPVLWGGGIYWIEPTMHVGETPMLYRIPVL